MARLSPKQRSLYSEKILDLANLAVAALIFGQFVSDTDFSWLLTATGGVVYVSLTIIALELSKESEFVKVNNE